MYIFVSGMCMKHCKLHISQYYHSDWSRSESTAIPESLEYHQVHKNKTLYVQCNHYNKEHSHLKAHFNQSQHTHTHCKLMITTNSSSVTIKQKKTGLVSTKNTIIPSFLSVTQQITHLLSISTLPACTNLTVKHWQTSFFFTSTLWEETLCGTGVALIERIHAQSQSSTYQVSWHKSSDYEKSTEVAKKYTPLFMYCQELFFTQLLFKEKYSMVHWWNKNWGSSRETKG